MAERFRSTNQSNPSRNRTAAPQPAIRRNIFQGAGPNARAARRPGPVSADSAETILDVEAPEPESTEIVVRDCHGEIVMDDLPTLELDELGEDEDEEGKQEMERGYTGPLAQKFSNTVQKSDRGCLKRSRSTKIALKC